MLSRVLIISAITGTHGPEQAEQLNIIVRHLSARGNDVILYGKYCQIALFSRVLFVLISSRYAFSIIISMIFHLDEPILNNFDLLFLQIFPLLARMTIAISTT